MKNFYYISFFIVFLIIGVLLCSKNIGGGGTIETTNGIVGYIQTEDNLPVDGAIVKLIPENYDPVKGNIEGDIIIDTTDENGSYSFRNILAGKYNIIARQVLEYKSLIVKDIIVNEKSITKVTKGIIKKSATINVKLFNPVVKEDNYIYIPGTDIFSYVNNDGFVTLQDVPCGKITEIVLTYGDAKKENIITDTLEINANENKTIEWSLWNYKRKIVLNTTSNGANVQKNIYNFPLLIRLTNDNFDFSTVNDNEEDFVFTKVDNTILNSEIERWD
ncbi:MAG: carboxypeptidase-like regulatory domain-containing protein, partial [Chitinispirillaceae bacterium]|nr:carboxypeptidase-like regulatory domain-containing protein [Chitinispirillaceae bacterium]